MARGATCGPAATAQWLTGSLAASCFFVFVFSFCFLHLSAQGLPIPSSLPFVTDVKEVSLWSALDRWYAQDAQPDDHGGSTASAASASSSAAPAVVPESAYFDAYVAVKQLLEANGVAWQRGGSGGGSSSAPLGGLHLVRDRDERARWVCQRHAVRFFPEGHEPKAGSAAALAIAAALAAEREAAEAEADAPSGAALGANAAASPSGSSAAAAAAAVGSAEARDLRLRVQQLQAENERLSARLAASSPEARTAKVAPDAQAAATRRSLSLSQPPPRAAGDDKKKSSACVVC